MYLRLLSTVSANPPLPTAIVFGVGDGIGSSTVTKFVSKGYNVIGVRRTPNSLTELQNTLDDADFEGQFYPMDSIDARKEEDVEAVFTRANDLPGPLECVVHNIGANITFPITETTSRKFSKCWEMACFSGFLVGREAARHMKIDPALPPPHPRSILFTGATASVRGSANFAAFAVAKSGLRALSQSLARELGPKQQIHVGHIVIDSAVDTEWIRTNFKKQLAMAPADAVVDPDAIADAFYFMHGQKRCAWTHEMDIRPYCEKW